MDRLVRITFLLLLSSIVSNRVCGQETKLVGTILDRMSGEAIAYANVTLGLASSDPYRIESFAVSDADGRFTLKLRNDSVYLLQASYLGYRTVVDTVISDELPRDYVLRMLPANNELDIVEVTYKIPIRVSGDTVSYAAEAFTDGNERKLEDVLKKLPGFTVDDSGQISVNGKKIDDLKVDGKDFFGGNSKLAARGLPANAVDRIDVLNNYSEDEGLGQFGDQRGTALNIRLSEDKKSVVFGEGYLGYGPGGGHDLGGDAFYFGPTTSVNLISNFNDVGRQVLTYQDMFRFNGGFAADHGSGTISFSPAQLGLGMNPELNAEHRADLATLNIQYQPSLKSKVSGTVLYGKNGQRKMSRILRTVLGREARSRVEQNETGTEENRSFTGLLRMDFEVSDKVAVSYRAIASTGNLGMSADTRISTTDGRGNSGLLQRHDERDEGIRQQVRITYGKTERELWALRLDHQTKLLSGQYAIEGTDIPFDFLHSTTTDPGRLLQDQENRIASYGGQADYYRSLNNTNQLNLYGGIRREESGFSSLLTTREGEVVESGVTPSDDFSVQSLFAGLIHRLKVKKWRVSPGLRFEHSTWNQRVQNLGTTGNRSFYLPRIEVRYDVRKSSSITLAYDQSISWPGADKRTSALVLRDLFSITRGGEQLRETRHHNISFSYYNYDLFNQTTYAAGITASRMERPLTQQILLRDTEQIVTSVTAERPGEYLAAYFQASKYMEHFKFSGSLETSLASSQVELEQSAQINRLASSSLSLRARTRFEDWPNLVLSGNMSYNNYRAGEQGGRAYLSVEPSVRLFGTLLSRRLSMHTEYVYRNYRQLKGNNRNSLDRLKAGLRYETKNGLFSFEVTAYNLLNRDTYQRERFSDFLLNVRQDTILGRRLIIKAICQL